MCCFVTKKTWDRVLGQGCFSSWDVGIPGCVAVASQRSRAGLGMGMAQAVMSEVGEFGISELLGLGERQQQLLDGWE